MAATVPVRDSRTARQNHPQIAKPPAAAIDHAVRLIYAICGLAGSPTLIDDIRADLTADKVRGGIRHHDSEAVFDWLMAALSYQGIADQVAYECMERHGRAAWRDIDQKLGRGASCPKLKSYWHFHGCRYEKASRACAEPDHIASCPLPSHDLRNGHLNQTAYSLFLFIRDLVDGDLIGWIDAQLQAADSPPDPARLSRMTAALIEVGGRLIAIDTLVHNFLHRTGILARFKANHSYGGACYRPGGCADIIAAVAQRIDARQFNPAFPATFPRFVQHAIWQYCSQSGLDVCNGNRIDDAKRCANLDCRVRAMCDRVALRKATEI